MKKFLPYLLITLVFAVFIVFWHRGALTYKFNPNLVNDYLRSQDIEDPKGLIKDRIVLSDNDLYLASGYLYAKGASPITYDFQVPPFIKYLFGFSILLTGNPMHIQIIFGLILLYLTYFLGIKLFRNQFVAFAGTLLLLIDPVFGGMMNEALLDIGQTTLMMGYIILNFFYPGAYILSGILLGLTAASKFWSTVLIFVGLIYFYKIVIKREKLDYKKTAISFLVAFLAFSLVYLKAFIDAGGAFNIFAFLLRDLRFNLTHNSAGILGGPIALYISGAFLPWWKSGILRAPDWSILWPVGLVASIILAVKTKIGDIKFFFYLLPIAYLLSMSIQVPFTRYFLLILPIIYLSLANLLASFKSK